LARFARIALAFAERSSPAAGGAAARPRRDRRRRHRPRDGHRSALANAASIAKMILTTECIVAGPAAMSEDV
jgi:hypothetical protein